jgi:hypothetical protein
MIITRASLSLLKVGRLGITMLKLLDIQDEKERLSIIII